MNKAEMASYLVSLHTLLEAQTKGSHALANAALADEYERTWAALKDTIKKERENESRQNADRPVGSQAGTDQSSGQPGRS